MRWKKIPGFDFHKVSEYGDVISMERDIPMKTKKGEWIYRTIKEKELKQYVDERGYHSMNLRKLARGKQCCVRIPGVCNGNPETTVLAHLSGGGMGMKRPDLAASWTCSDCHDVVDFRRIVKGLEPMEIRVWHLEGIIRTQQELLKMGLATAIDDWKEITEF